MSFYYELIEAMREWDLHTNSINLETGIYHRFRSIGECKSKCCEYRVFERQLGAHFKCWRRGINRFWFAKRDNPFSIEDHKIMQAERAKVRREQKLIHRKVSEKCERFFYHLEKKGRCEHAYVLRKKIKPYSARIARQLLVLPVSDVFMRFQTLQFIQPNGFKRLKAGGKASEGMVWLAAELLTSYEGIIRVCEGWSTGCTLREVTNEPVVCALNAFNLIKVCIALRKRFFHAEVRICADNDAWGKKNTGLDCATEAQEKTGYNVYYPTFEGLNCDDKPTDFNDLFVIGGKSEVLKQI